ncbi:MULTISPECIES: DUF3301 domain-containing protein [Nitrincola]|uniref:DUF3301 domain-containing protein n=1 Tax=Nitrincola nitratireducens TaxID=1229521 RepID=W9V5Y6_9GAMM|nr:MULTISPECIES: DUF3301 domain-containing protein [Nitrincola]EXJ11527.1 hypothetical protein D791_01659 [Nitrincola nitratireducens]
MTLDLIDLLVFLGIGVIALAWWNNLKAKEQALKAVMHYCDRHHLQLLDQSIALIKIRPARNETGRLHLQRTYLFEFTSTGDERYKGKAFMLGSSVYRLDVDAHRID